MPIAPRLLLGDVRPGDSLPELAYDVTATTVVLGALATRDWRPMHHDQDFAQQRNGVRDIFLNTPNQAAWFERYLTDLTGPHGRLARMSFRMKDSIFPGDRMRFAARVAKVAEDDTGCGWVDLSVTLSVGERVCTECEARLSLPRDAAHNPWKLKGDRWRP